MLPQSFKSRVPLNLGSFLRLVPFYLKSQGSLQPASKPPPLTGASHLHPPGDSFSVSLLSGRPSFFLLSEGLRSHSGESQCPLTH